jgi:O-antigen ligase
LLLVLLVSCVLSIGAIHDYMGGKLDLGGKRIKGMIGGMFDNPNDLALHLVTMIPIALGLLFTSRAFLKKLFYGSAAILMTAGVVVTFSRGGFLALICMGTLLAWRIGRRNKWLILLVVPIILVTFIVLAPGGYGNRLATTSDESALARLDDLKRSIFITLHHPVMGVGMENYILFSNSNHATHNSFTQVSSELGLAALLVYLLFQIAPLRGLAKITRETSDSRRQSHFYYLSVGLAASIIGYMVASFFASVAFLWYVYFLVGYAVCLRRLYEASDEHVL